MDGRMRKDKALKPGDLVMVPGVFDKGDPATGMVRSVLPPYCRVAVRILRTKGRIMFFRIEEVDKL